MEANEQVVEQTQVDPYAPVAAAQGWVPKEEFKGDPEKWVDAKQFIERGEKVIPILKERNEHLVKEIRELKTTFGEYAKFAEKAEERAYNRAMADLSARKEQAVLDSDIDTFKAVEKEQLDLIKSRQETQPANKETVTKDSHPAFEVFRSENDWYGKDPELSMYADSIGQFLDKTSGLQGKAFFDKVAEEVKQRFPAKFTNTRRENNQSVEGVSETGIPRRSGGRTYNDLPSEAKAACDKFVARIPGYTKEQYLKDYEWE